MNYTPKKDDIASLLKDPETGSPLVDKQEILLQFHICARTLQRWRSEEGLKYYKIGKKLFYSEKDIQVLLKRCQVTPKKKKK